MEAKIILTTELQLKAIVADAVNAAFKYYSTSTDPHSTVEPYGDFNWLVATCIGVPASTLRIKSASGEIPGVVKFGRRVLYDKAIVLNYLKSQTRQSALSTDELEQAAEEQISHQLAKKSA